MMQVKGKLTSQNRQQSGSLGDYQVTMKVSLIAAHASMATSDCKRLLPDAFPCSAPNIVVSSRQYLVAIWNGSVGGTSWFSGACFFLFQQVIITALGGIILNKFTLGAAITAAALAVAPFASAATIVQNGSFEQAPGAIGIDNHNNFSAMPGASGNASWDVFKNIPGWTTDAGDGVEIQTKNTIPLTPYDGDYYAELDGNQNSTISQQITFGVGQYKLSFAFSPRVAGNTGTNQISYGIDGLFDLVVTGPSASYPLNVWTVVTQIFTVKTAGEYALYFDAAGKSDSLGGFIDGIEVASVPVPAAGFLLFGALGGLAALRRRKSTAA